MENRRTSTMASRRIPSMERGRINFFSMEDGRIPSFNAFLTKNAISVHYAYGIQISLPVGDMQRVSLDGIFAKESLL